MRLSLGRRVCTIAVWLAVALLALLGPGSSVALAARTGPAGRHDSDRVEGVPAQVAEVLSVLDRRMGGKVLPERARDKLRMLDGGRLRLIASLSERIADAGQSPAADIALFLIAALIVLD